MKPIFPRSLGGGVLGVIGLSTILCGVLFLGWGRSGALASVGLTGALVGIYALACFSADRRLGKVACYVERLADRSVRRPILGAEPSGDGATARLGRSFSTLASRVAELEGQWQRQLVEKNIELDSARRELAEETARRTEAQLELSRALAEAEECRQARRQFVCNVGHEIRTPMTAILGFSESLFDADLSEDDRRQSMEAIQRNGKQLLELIDDILELAMAEAGTMPVKRRGCRSDELLGKTLPALRRQAEAKGLEFRVRLEGSMPETLMTDANCVVRILSHLVGSAVKFTEKGEIEVTVRFRQEPEPRLEVEVRDTGIGMEGEPAERIFLPFTQEDASTVRRFGGTGLGLALSRRLARSLGGDVVLVSTSPGEGSRFRATIPAVPCGQEPSEPSDGEPRGGVRPPVEHRLPQPCKVLLAEDGADNQRLISLILRKAGAEVTVVENGDDAVREALGDGGHPAFDVILMDMQMPVLDGYGATGQLRKAGYGGPIVALTAHAMADDRQKCLDAGCDAYSPKPVDRKALLRLLGDLLEAQRRA